MLLPGIRKKTMRMKSVVVAGLFGGLLCLTRPDSPLYIASVCVGVLIICGVTRRTLVQLGAFIVIPVLCVCGQLAFRLAYYGEWLPNTALVKISFFINNVSPGNAPECVGDS